MVDGAGQVTLGQSYDPFGNIAEQGGSGASGFGFTGEQEDVDTGLVFLRARYYDPATGRFVSKDPWSGSMLRPQTQNGWAYVSNNPLNQTDPSGLCEGYTDWECWIVYRRLIQKFPHLPEYFEQQYGIELYTMPKAVLENNLNYPSGETIVQGSPSGVLALMRLFEADHLPGRDAKERLQWILNQQASYGLTSSYLQFGDFFPLNDSGFCEELADQVLYDKYWKASIQKLTSDPTLNPKSGQIGHFLTAVALGFNPQGAAYQLLIFNPGQFYNSDYFSTSRDPFSSMPLSTDVVMYNAEEHALNLMVGHEMRGDLPGLQGWLVAIPEQYSVATEDARQLFLKAVEYDRLRNEDMRNQALQAILLSTDSNFTGEALSGPERIGNSLQDLLNSLKGWRFGQEIANGTVTSRQGAADWLRREIYDASRTRKALGYD